MINMCDNAKISYFFHSTRLFRNERLSRISKNKPQGFISVYQESAARCYSTSMGYLVNEFHLKQDEISKPNNAQMPVDIIYLSSYISNFKKESVFYQT
jgi:hypothetical protein